MLAAAAKRAKTPGDVPSRTGSLVRYKPSAERLVVSHLTVQNHVQNSLGKLRLHNRVELTRYAIEQGLTRTPDGPSGSA